MPIRGGRAQGGDQAAQEEDDGDGALLRGDEGDDEVEGAGLLPMDPEKTLAMVLARAPYVSRRLCHVPRQRAHMHGCLQ